MANLEQSAAPPPTPTTANRSQSVPVWDPESETLRAVSASDAKGMQDEGYAVGPQALHESDMQSLGTKVKGFVGTAANTAAAGLPNLALAYTGHQDAVKALNEYRDYHPYAATAADLLGYGASLAAGPARIGLGLLGKAAGKNLATRIGAHLLAPGAAAAAVQGSADELTREKLVNDPVHLDQIAASAFSHVVWNAAANALGYSVGKLPAALRAAGGNWADWAERVGWHVPQMRRIPVAEQEAAATRLSRATFSGQGALDDNFVAGQLKKAEGINGIKERMQAAEQPGAQAEAASAGSGAGEADSALPVQGSEASAATSDPTHGTIPSEAKPDEIKPTFQWAREHTKKDKQQALTRMMKQVIGKDETNLQLWNESTRLSKDIGSYKSMVKSGHLDRDKTAPIIDNLVRQKEEIKRYLNQYVPRVIEGDKFTPGFEDLDREYARVSGNTYHDIADPSFGAQIPRARGDVAKVQPKEKYSVAFSFPKPPAQTQRVGIKQPFTDTKLQKLAMYTAFIPGLGLPGKAALAYMEGRNLLATAASHREGIGNVVGAAGDKLLKYGTPPLQAAVKTYGARGEARPYDEVEPVDVKVYNHATDVLNTAATNQQAIQSYFAAQYPQFMEAHPEAAAKVQTSIMRAAQLLNNTVPKRPYRPTLRDTNFTPPRAQQVRMLSRWQILSNPQMALRTGDPQTLQILKDAYPDWYEHASQRLIVDTQAFKGPVAGHVARNITAFTGAPVNPINNSAALKRMFATAGPLPDNNSPSSPSGGKVGGGAQSAKTSNAAAQRDDPSFELN